MQKWVSALEVMCLTSQWEQLLLLSNITSLWPSVLNPCSSIIMCISEKCPPESGDQIVTFKSGMFLVCTGLMPFCVQLDCCWLTSAAVRRETWIWKASQGYWKVLLRANFCPRDWQGNGNGKLKSFPRISALSGSRVGISHQVRL